jgi:hypothetical protein
MRPHTSPAPPLTTLTAREAGLTSKPRHAQRQQDALRGSFRPRLASTFNHRTTRSPETILDLFDWRLRSYGQGHEQHDADPAPAWPRAPAGRRQTTRRLHSKRRALLWWAIIMTPRGPRAREALDVRDHRVLRRRDVVAVLAHLPAQRHVFGEHEVALVESADLFEDVARMRKHAPDTQSTVPSLRGDR